ncbi:response regulator [Belnapia sp. T18]|uniref:Response regulator n=1 Tax=Belnapia arida TaxID=2804533 RepID=A0ABS1U7C5_9PROT|nr:response regulator [Belnapia arida]MBL6079211.1 response regulator [Belnapia arida]
MNALILVADDEADMEPLFRQQFRRDIKAGRFQLVFTTSAQQALRVIDDAGPHDIVLLLSDINMPEMSGLDLLARVKVERPNLSVIMVTAYGDADTRRRALAGGADGLLPKPIDFSALRAEVDRCLAQWRAGP